ISVRDRFRRDVLTHVVLHARLERRYAGRGGDVQREIRAAGFRGELIEANARKLRRLVERLDWTPEPSVWSMYDATTSYSEADAERKESFVRAAAGRRRWRLIWDLGCNDGRFTRIAAEHADYAVALDADAAVVEGFYRTLRSQGSTTILPLVADLADPPPGLAGEARLAVPVFRMCGFARAAVCAARSTRSDQGRGHEARRTPPVRALVPRGRPAALRPARAQPGVLRRARLDPLGRHAVRACPHAAAAGGPGRARARRRHRQCEAPPWPPSR